MGNQKSLWRLALCLLGALQINCQDELDVGHFWHITDMHWDPTYNTSNKALSCGPKATGNGYGAYGDYLCDAPWLLINSSVYAMKKLHNFPDFLIWTGDDTPHIWNDTILNKNLVRDIIFDLTDIIQEVWPNYPVYSALGNHDWSPKNQLPPTPDDLYNAVADKWEKWLNDTLAKETFRKAGYYSMDHSRHIKVIILNTNLYYESNKLTENMEDPGEQFEWLEDEMKKAQENNQKVILVGHVPPGQFEKHPDKYWFYPEYNRYFNSFFKRYADIIGSMHFAHHHTDSFRMVYNSQGQAVSSMLLAPAVTPWETTLPGVLGGAANNPGLRVIKFHRKTGEVLDIEQYYLNLTKANELNQDSWELLYKGTNYYNVQDMGTESLSIIANQLFTDDDIFARYYNANGVAYDPDEKCEGECRKVHYCAVTRLDYDDYQECMNATNPIITPPGAASSLSTTWSTLGLTLFLASIQSIHQL